MDHPDDFRKLRLNFKVHSADLIWTGVVTPNMLSLLFLYISLTFYEFVILPNCVR